MPSRQTIPALEGQRTSYITISDAPEPLWLISEAYGGSFIVQAPIGRPRRKLSPRATDLARRRRSDAWPRMAGRLEVVADAARQAARAARGRDPKAFDLLMDGVREALLDAIVMHNVSEELLP